MRHRRVYSETLPHAELIRPRVLELLARYRVELVVAVRPWEARAFAGLARALGERAIPLSIWPMLADAEGRWGSAHNADAFRGLVLSLCDALEEAGALPRDVLLDLEPPIALARSLTITDERPARRVARLADGLRGPGPRAFAAASGVLARTVADLRGRGVATSTAVWPLVALDPPGGTAWQSLLGTPVDPLGASHVSVMVYTSILEGWSRGALRRADIVALLAAAAARSVERWREAAGISLGCVGAGAFENEPVYRDPSELAEDVAVARAAGCEALSLFDLGGVLVREPAEAWLDAFTSSEEPPRAPGAGRATGRVRLASTMARAATWALARARPRP